MTIYIAGPMTGYPDFNYPAFREAETALAAAGHEVLCPVDSEQHNDTGKPQTWEWYMRHALRMVTESHSIALLPGWEASRGARLEVHVGEQLGLVIRPLEAWLGLAEAFDVLRTAVARATPQHAVPNPPTTALGKP